MKFLKSKKLKLLLICLITSISFSFTNASEEKIDAIIDQLEIINNDLKTLEKAVYNNSDIKSAKSLDGLDEDVLTRHLLKLNEIEDQFRSLTNRFEEVNFKLDKLSNRVTKIQTDSQLRFSDLESGNVINTNKSPNKIKNQAALPGTDKAQDFGSAPGYNSNQEETIQATQSIESAGTVVTEKPENFTSTNQR